MVFLKKNRSKDYTAPVNFVSAGLRKTAAEEKQPQQKQEEDSDDSDGDGPSAHPPPRGAAPKKLQMVKNECMLCNHCSIFCNGALSKQLLLYFSFSRVISGGTSPRDLQVAFSLVKDLVAGRNTLKALDRNFCRKWATNRAKAWARMHKVGWSEYISKHRFERSL